MLKGKEESNAPCSSKNITSIKLGKRSSRLKNSYDNNLCSYCCICCSNYIDSKRKKDPVDIFAKLAKLEEAAEKREEERERKRLEFEEKMEQRRRDGE